MLANADFRARARGATRGVVACVLIAGASGASSAGDLAPPTGPVQATMLRLDEIEARTPININTTPGDAAAVFVITEPGSYFLTSDVQGQVGKHGIEVRLSQNTPNNRVNIDFNGFALLGVPGSGDGIHLAANPGVLDFEFTVKPDRIEFKGGIVNWGGNGVNIGGASRVELTHLEIGSSGLDGVCVVGAREAVISSVSSSGNGGDGVNLQECSITKMLDTACDANGGDGMNVGVSCTNNSDVFVEFSSSVSSNNGGHGARVANLGDAFGLFCSAKFDCVGVTTCTNTLDGVHVEDISFTKYVDSVAMGNGGDGISARISCNDNSDSSFSIGGSNSSGNGGNGVKVTNGGDSGGVFCSAKFDCDGLTACNNMLDGVNVEDIGRTRCADLTSMGNGGDGLYTRMATRAAREGFFDIAASSMMGNGGQGAHVERAAGSAASYDKCFWSSVGACGNLGDGVRLDGISHSSMRGCALDLNDGSGMVHTYAPGNPVYGNITFEKCSASGNGGTGLDLTQGTSASITNRFLGCRTSENGALVGVGHGVHLRSSGAGGGGRIAVYYESCVSDGNLGDGLRVRCDHHLALHSVRNCNAMVNTGAGIDIGRLLAPPSEVRVEIEELFSVQNGSHGMSLEGTSGAIRHSNCSNNAGDGMFLTLDEASIEHSECSSNGGSGASTRASGGGTTRSKCYTNHFRCDLNTFYGMDHEDTDATGTNIYSADSNEGGWRSIRGSVRLDGFSLRRNGGVGGSGGAIFIECETVHLLAGESSGNFGNGLTFTACNSVRCETVHLTANTGDGARVDNGLLACGTTPHFLHSSSDGNGGDGFSVQCANGGQLTECHAHRNSGAGIRVGTVPDFSVTGVQLDRCYASLNTQGVVVDDAQNIVLRTMARENLIDNLRLHPDTFAGPSVAGPAWIESKPYAWP